MCLIRLTLFLLALSCLADPAHAWGRLGHETSGHLASRELSPAAQQAIHALLDGRDLAETSTWADVVRPDRDETAPLHYINGPQTRLEPRDEDYELAEGNVYSAVLGYAKILADESNDPLDRAEALKFLVHFIGDLHQPLHTGFRDDRGGNDIPVIYRGELTNLHRYWDTLILTTGRPDYQAPELAAILFERHSPSQRQAWAGETDPRAWIIEARALIFNGLYPMPRTDLTETIDAPVGVMDLSYGQVWQPIADLQLSRAGSRIAATLNAIFETGQSPFDDPPIAFPRPAR
jgi:hypothetical protein